MEGIQVSTEVAGSKNDVSIIKVGGYIDTTTSSEVERALNSLLKQGNWNIVIDLGNVDYISSAGWGIFISEIKSIRENNGDLKLVRMIPDVYEIFELLEFHHILDVYDSTQEAVQKFEESQYAGVKTAVETHAGPEPSDVPFSTDLNLGSNDKSPLETVEETEQLLDNFPSDETNQEPEVVPRQHIKDLSSISVEDKIKYIVGNDPNIGAFKINKKLNTLEFGFTKVGWFGVRSILNKLLLNSRKNRRHFAQKYRQA
jgi:anti-sigma B factor antagonist